MNTANLFQTSSESASPPCDAAVAILQQGLELMSHLSDDAYRQNIPSVFNGSLGGHYRHCLDHFDMMLSGLDTGAVNYDARHRNRSLETNRSKAAEKTRDLIRKLEQIPLEKMDLSLVITIQPHYADAVEQHSTSTIKRELLYVIAHAVHHYAIMAIMGAQLGITLPTTFGMAPSTLHHLSKSTPQNHPAFIAQTG